MDHISDLKTGHMDGSLEQQALTMIDGVIDEVIELIVHRLPASSKNAEEAKLRIKVSVNREIHRLTAQGRQM